MSAVSPVIAKYNARVAATGSMVCVGLDPEAARIPEHFRITSELGLFGFNRYVIEQTAPYAAAYKCNTAFYEAFGSRGWAELERTTEFLREHVPDALLICDAKRADIGNTNRGYVQGIFDAMGFDAITLHPYLGERALQPFLERADKASIILCRTSNDGGDELQELAHDGSPLWLSVARNVTERWNANGNCMLVVGAQHTHAMKAIREFAPQIPLLVPGVGAQGGEAAAVVRAGLSPDGSGLIINSSRGILFSGDPERAARELRDETAGAREATLATQ